MAVPTPVATQLAALNAAVNRLIADRDRINDLFEDGLGASTWSLLSAPNQTLVKNALITDMQAASTQIDTVIAALQTL